MAEKKRMRSPSENKTNHNRKTRQINKQKNNKWINNEWTGAEQNKHNKEIGQKHTHKQYNIMFTSWRKNGRLVCLKSFDLELTPFVLFVWIVIGLTLYSESKCHLYSWCIYVENLQRSPELRRRPRSPPEPPVSTSYNRSACSNERPQKRILPRSKRPPSPPAVSTMDDLLPMNEWISIWL